MCANLLSRCFCRRVVLFFSGLLMPLAFAPFHLWWVGLFSVGALMVLAAHSTTVRGAMADGGSYGLGMFLAGVHWVYVSVGVYGGGGVPGGGLTTLIFVVYLALYPACVTGGAFLLARRCPSRQRTLMVFLWVLMEWLRGVLLSGFPWLILGHAMIDSPLAGWGPVGGGLLLSLLALVTVRACLWFGESRRWLRLLPLGVLLMIWGVGATLDPVRWTRPQGSALSVALVQGNMTQDLKWRPELRDVTIEHYLRLTEPLWGRHDLVVWPETAVPDFFHTVIETLIEPLDERVARESTTLMMGVPVFDFSTHAYYNGLLVLGEAPHWYFKRHLVPFGEYLPLRRWVGDRLTPLGMPAEDFSAGSAARSVVYDRGHFAGLSICFEIVQTYLIRRDAQRASYLVNISNDAWFGHSMAPHQHLQIARMRALETNRPVVRATNTGVSALIAADGRLIASGPQFQAVVVAGEISPRHGMTPYVRWGDVPVLAIVIVGILGGALDCLHRRRAVKGCGFGEEGVAQGSLDVAVTSSPGIADSRAGRDGISAVACGIPSIFDSCSGRDDAQESGHLV